MKAVGDFGGLLCKIKRLDSVLYPMVTVTARILNGNGDRPDTPQNIPS